MDPWPAKRPCAAAWPPVRRIRGRKHHPDQRRQTGPLLPVPGACSDGDEIVIPRPCWVSFTEQIKLAGGRPVLVDTGRDFQLDPDALRACGHPAHPGHCHQHAQQPHRRGVWPRSPGRGGPHRCRNRLYLIADEAYHAFTYDGRPTCARRDVCADRERVITVRSFSKHYNMTGFRVGYVAAAGPIIQALARLQSHSTGNVCTFAQHGALAAPWRWTRPSLPGGARCCSSGVTWPWRWPPRFSSAPPARARFYLFADVSACLRKDESQRGPGHAAAQRAGVAVVPGEAFHGPGHVRISYAAAEEDLRRAFAKNQRGVMIGLIGYGRFGRLTVTHLSTDFDVVVHTRHGKKRGHRPGRRTARFPWPKHAPGKS
jgi:aspartate aminotransferase